MLKLYYLPLSLNSYKVRLLLAFLGVQYESQIVDLMKGEHKTPEFLALNPFGQVPLLQDGKLLLRDSQAIIVWLARKYGSEQWMPRDADQEAVVNAWLAAAAFELRLGPYDARLAKNFPLLCVNYHTVRENSARALRLFEDRLKGREWLALDHPTVADVAAYPAIAHSSDGDISLDGYDAIRAWLTRVEKLPGSFVFSTELRTVRCVPHNRKLVDIRSNIGTGFCAAHRRHRHADDAVRACSAHSTLLPRRLRLKPLDAQ